MQIIPKDKVIFDFNKENNFNYSIEDGRNFLCRNRGLL